MADQKYYILSLRIDHRSVLILKSQCGLFAEVLFHDNQDHQSSLDFSVWVLLGNGDSLQERGFVKNSNYHRIDIYSLPLPKSINELKSRISTALVLIEVNQFRLQYCPRTISFVRAVTWDGVHDVRSWDLRPRDRVI